MSVITLRGLSAETARRVRSRASREGKSINRFLVELVENKVLGSGTGKPREYHDLDDLIGSLNETDVRHMEKAVSKQRRIDAELWS